MITKEMSNRIKSIRFLMTCIIAFYHCNYSGEAVSPFDRRANSLIDSTAETVAFAAMCWFFSISGFLLFRNLTFKNYAEKLKKRTFSLLLPYFIWQIASFALIIISALIRHAHTAPKELIRGFIDGVFLMKSWPPNGALWYLYALFLLTALSPVLLLLFKNKRVGWIVAAALTVLIYRLNYTDNLINQYVFSYGYVKLIITYFPSFILGAFMGHFSENSDGTDKIKYILFLLSVSIVFESAYPGMVKDCLVRVLPILLLYFMPTVSALDDRKIYRLSFLIYAIHQPLLEIRRLLLPIVSRLPYAFCANLALRILFVITVIAAAALIRFVLGKLAPKLLKAVTGGRS